MNRREFVAAIGCGLVSVAGALSYRSVQARNTIHATLRPPGALDESAFLSACIRCGHCSAVCPRGCIVAHSLSDGPALAGVPFIDPRRRACNLCMKCTSACPTGALLEIPAEKSIVASSVSMGVAVIEKSLCISFLGRMCGLCRDACPYPGEAIKLEPWARPIIIDDHCVGCGLCAEICPQQPSAIVIDPGRRRST
jgi:MauM/NapG family ferredoxin protein